MYENNGTAVQILKESDIVVARKEARKISDKLKFTLTDTTRIVTAVSELARNIFHYAGQGIMLFKVISFRGRTGIEFKFEDKGPGIDDLEMAMAVGYTSSKGLGMGLPGAKRLMDEFEIISTPGQGTTVTIRKWKK